MKISRPQFLYFVYWLQSHAPKKIDLYLQFLAAAKSSDSIKECILELPEIFGTEIDFTILPMAENKIQNLIEKQNVKFACYGEAEYPECFKLLDFPPLVISFLGEPVWQTKQFISVVGSREPCSDSLLWMDRELIAYLSHCAVGVVSGGARGVDQAAHRAALLAGQPTVVFVPAGLGKMYPKELSKLVPAVLASGGAFVSEYSFNQEMRICFFEARNRLIASMGSYLLVVEGKRRSGSLLTAGLAMAQGKTIACLPGHPVHPQFSGTLDLLVSGANLIRDRLDLLSLNGK